MCLQRYRTRRYAPGAVEQRRPKHLVLILAREFASTLATPMLISDADGNLVFFNEPAGGVLGRSFDEVGELPASRWAELFETEELDGTPVPLARMPAGIALMEARPAHHRFVIKGLDAVRRVISVTAFPLLAHTDDLVGVVAIFWRENTGDPQQT
jgi:PAS domain-containing protein